MLAYEVLLTRLFSIVLWHHFAYMIISAAMLGYGASGTALALLKEKISSRVGAAYVAATAAMALLMPAAFLLAQRIPFNPLELLWDNAQLARLLAVYLLMMLPFFCGGLAIGLVLWRFGSEAGRVYACDILGAGAGSLGVMGILFLLAPDRLLALLCSVAFLAAAIAIMEMRMRPGWLSAGFLSLAVLAAGVPPRLAANPAFSLQGFEPNPEYHGNAGGGGALEPAGADHRRRKYPHPFSACTRHEPQCHE